MSLWTLPMSIRKIDLEFAPYPEQRRVLDSDTRFRVVAAGRRSGKTLMAAFETVRRAVRGNSDWRGYWVGAEYSHCQTAFEVVDKVVPDAIVERRKHSPPREIEFYNGAALEFHTASGGALVSMGLDWAVADEAAKDFPERSWTQELRPALSDREGSAMFISTPDGRGWFYDRFEYGRDESRDDWQSWRWSTYQNPHVDDAEIDAARGTMPERIFRQEYKAEFLDESGGVFSDLGERLFTLDGDVDPTPPFAHGWDFARHEDYLVGLVLDAYGRVVDFHRSQGDAWPQIQSLIERKATEFDGVVALDASRDNKIVADLHDAGLAVKPVKFSPKRKRELIEDLIARIESGELSAPDIPQLRHELSIFEYDVTPSGTVRYNAPEGFHDDCVDALALASSQLDQIVPRKTDNVDESGISYL